MILLLLRIELCDYELNLLSCILLQILLVSIRYQACRDEDSCLVNDYAQSAGPVPVQP